jgi:hypothetical protein
MKSAQNFQKDFWKNRAFLKKQRPVMTLGSPVRATNKTPRSPVENSKGSETEEGVKVRTMLFAFMVSKELQMKNLFF